MTERESMPPELSCELQRRITEIRRKVAIIRTRLDMLKEDPSDLLKRQNISLKQLGKLSDKFSSVTSKAQKVGGQFTMKYSSDSLCGSTEKSANIDVNSIANMDNHEIVKLQRKVIKEQDAELDILEETITSIEHITLAINGEVDLQTRLIESLGEDVEVTNNKLQRELKSLKALNTCMRKRRSFWGILFSSVAVVVAAIGAIVLVLI